MPKRRHIKLQVIPGDLNFELIANKKRNDGSTFSSAHVGTIDKQDWLDFIISQYEYLRVFGLLPGTTPATLIEQFAFQAKSVKLPFNAAQFDANVAEEDQ